MAKRFLQDLYREHLEEASFLYEQRLAYLNDPELTWLDLADFEERFEAHIDALVLGDDLALTVCRQQAGEGDFGELHAAVRVFCRLDRQDLFGEVLDALDTEDDERVQAISEALRHELPASWQEAVAQRMTGEGAALARLVAKALGYRRVAASEALMAALQRQEETVPALVWALGRLRASEARSLIFRQYLQQGVGEVRAAAALALLRMRDPAAVQFCRHQARTEDWALLPLGLGGSGQSVSVLMERVSTDAPPPDALLALGLLGDASAAEALLFHLEAEDLAEPAALALHLLTGADLYDEVFIPEEVDDDEFFDDERAALREEADGPDSAERGVTVTRISQDAETWRGWWRHHEERFRSSIRYRFGEPCLPTHLVRTLRTEHLPRSVRQMAYEELVIRYNIEAYFESDTTVVEQQHAIGELEQQVTLHSDTFQAGRWYFAGQLLSG